MSPDDLDDLIDERKADLEQRFRELEREEEIARMRGGGAPSQRPSESDPNDDLSHLKSAIGGDEPAAEAEDDTPGEGRYLLLLCPHCQAKNRTDLERVRTELPVCGACKKLLSFNRL